MNWLKLFWPPMWPDNMLDVGSRTITVGRPGAVATMFVYQGKQLMIQIDLSKDDIIKLRDDLAKVLGDET